MCPVFSPTKGGNPNHNIKTEFQVAIIFTCEPDANCRLKNRANAAHDDVNGYQLGEEGLIAMATYDAPVHDECAHHRSANVFHQQLQQQHDLLSVVKVSQGPGE